MQSNETLQSPGIDWKQVALDSRARQEADFTTSDFWNRPTVKLAKLVLLALICIPMVIFACIAVGRTLHYLRYPLEGLRPDLPATFSVESEAGRAAIYVDKATGARVLCAVGSQCIVLPATTPAQPPR